MISMRFKISVVLSVVQLILLMSGASGQIQLTNNPKYERSESVVKAKNGTYWLVYARADELEISQSDEDLDREFYTIYYKKASSVRGLASAPPILITPSRDQRPANFPQGEVAIAAHKNKIWVFAAASRGHNDPDMNIYAYTSRPQRSNWTGPVPILPSGAGAHHIDAVVDKRNRIWVFYQGWTISDDYKKSHLCYTKYDKKFWSTPKIISVDEGPNHTVPKAWYDKKNDSFCIVHCRSGNEINLTYSNSGASAWTTETGIIDESYSEWDPDIIYFEDKFYCFFTPLEDPRQWIASSTTTANPPISGWSTPQDELWAPGVYGSDLCHDWWPALLADRSQLYVFYTSERNSDGTAKGDGNIWVVEVPTLEKHNPEMPKESGMMPSENQLAQNYPNPFNPQTAIQFQLPKASQVTITVYNVLGEEIRTLIDDHHAAGSHVALWNGKDQTGNDVPSGVYLYQIKAGSFNKVMKMSLTR